MRRSSDRGQVEPLAVLAALLAISAALVVYAGALGDAVPEKPDSKTPQMIHDRIQQNISSTGVVHPGRLGASLERVPSSWSANATLVTEHNRWTSGPDPPGDAERVRSRVSVALGPDRIQPGQFRVVVWR